MRSSNLRDRLRHIQQIKKTQAPPQKQNPVQETDLIALGWQPCGFHVLKRDVFLSSPFKSKKKIPQCISIIIPDLTGKNIPKTEDFLFFDLETTGLSGGAGTVAFLAAFGRIKNDKLQITQYLLTDYPGENDFLEHVLAEFKNENQFVVSYNGKCFDSQIIKTRCLMNGIKPPFYNHADLLHPARRLWKNIIHDCSQASVEANILGIKRIDDIPGSLAPEIWFEFLKTGVTQRLMGICDHNTSDIFGLAKMLSVMICIANDPFDSKYEYDIGRLALFSRHFIRKNEVDDELRDLSDKVMKYAADKKCARAVYVYGLDLIRSGNYLEALKYAQLGISLFEVDSEYYGKLERRVARLRKKIAN